VSSQRFCIECGEAILPEVKFCTKCGTQTQEISTSVDVETNQTPAPSTSQHEAKRNQDTNVTPVVTETSRETKPSGPTITPKPSPSDGCALRVEDAHKRDIGHGKVRINSRAMRKLGIMAGDFVEIHGKKMTVAVAWPAYAEDQGQEIVRMDGLIRRNAGVALNEYVSAKKAEVKDAQAILFAPTDVRLNVDEEFVSFVKRRFMDMPFVEGDMTLLATFGSAVSIIVTRTSPHGAVKIDETSQVQVLSEPGISSGRIEKQGDQMSRPEQEIMTSKPESGERCSLRVQDARTRDVGHARARIDNLILQKLKITTGDFVDIHGKKMTVAIACSADAEDQDNDIVRIDGLIRRNAGAALNDHVTVKKAAVKDAKTIQLAPTDVRLTLDEEFVSFVKKRFTGTPFIKGDMTMLSIFGQAVPLIVTSTDPQGAVKMNEKTFVAISGEPIPRTSSGRKQRGISHRLSRVFGSK